MKFLCDRCKTRYSIGDDRVRGKILKIRCKNCANVITVREGMSDAEAAEPAGARRHKPTTMAPMATVGPPQNGSAPSALNAAFQSALATKPPAALEEEWYVSIDGEQEGPYSLTDAQRWVAGKPTDADLHCWSEGFDDWLPVDKVSHFRGLRKKPAPAPAPPPPASPPPLPRMATAAGAARVTARPAEDEPKPLFAATMASLERNAPVSPASLGLPPPASARPSATPPGGTPALSARANGTAKPVTPPAASPPVVPSPAPSPIGKKTAPGQGMKVPAFDVAEGATQIDSPAFNEDAPTSAEPVAAAARRVAAEASDPFARAAERHARQDAAATSPQMPPAKEEAASTSPRLPLSALAANAPVTAATDKDADEDDELAIGEVSRVVNLADLMRSKPAPAATGSKTGAVPRLPTSGLTGAVPRLNATGAVPRLGATGMVPKIDDPNAPPPPTAEEIAAAQARVAAAHRRHMIMLIGAALLLLAGVVVAVVLLVFNSENVTNNSLAGGDQIDTTRPDDPLRRLGIPGPTPGVGSNTTGPTKSPGKRPNTGGNQISTNNGRETPNTPEIPTGSLSSDEIEDMARKHATMTQRCYMRSQKGADAILIGDVKKITATLDIGADGTVKDVSLSNHAANNLGKCLISAIKGWRFRTSPKGGMYKISLQFVGA